MSAVLALLVPEGPNDVYVVLWALLTVAVPAGIGAAACRKEGVRVLSKGVTALSKSVVSVKSVADALIATAICIAIVVAVIVGVVVG